MARSFASASSQALIGSATPVSQSPVTLAAWIMRTSSPGATQAVITISDNTTTDDALELRLTAAYALEAVEKDGATLRAATATGTVAINTWTHVVGVFVGAAERYAYRDGGNSGSSLQASSAAGLDVVSIGCQNRGGTPSGFFNGHIAHAAVWTAALSAAEVARLYNSGIGADPRSVRPDALVAYWPLLNADGDQDYWGNFHLTASGSPTYAQHPPVLMRSRPKYVILGSAAPTVGEVTITGTRTIGETITANATPTPGDATLTYQWEKSSTGVGAGTDISGETASTLALTYADFGDILDTAAYVRCGVVATKDAVPSVETFSSWLEVSAGGAASVGSPFVSSSIR